MKNIGSRIKNARLAKNLKQEELAKLLGTKKPTVVSLGNEASLALVTGHFSLFAKF